MKQIILLTSLAIGLWACNNPKTKETTSQKTIIHTSTPKALDGSIKMGMGSRKKADIVNRLYLEALDKYSELDELNDAMNQLIEDDEEFTQTMNNYTSTNDEYWSTSKRYIQSISDSTLMEATLKTLNEIKESYSQEIKIHESNLTELKNKSEQLNDQIILLKVLVTQTMIKGYQKNELPDLKQLQEINNRYDLLIQDTKVFLNKESI